MNNLEKKFIDENGTEKIMIAESNDSEEVRLEGGYTIAGRKMHKENKLTEQFKGSLLGADIGHRSGGFSSVLGLALVIAVAVLVVLYFVWKF